MKIIKECCDPIRKNDFNAMLLPVGVVFSSHMEGQEAPEICLRVYNGIISLENPNNTWMDRSYVTSMECEILEGEVIVRRKV